VIVKKLQSKEERKKKIDNELIEGVRKIRVSLSKLYTNKGRKLFHSSFKKKKPLIDRRIKGAFLWYYRSFGFMRIIDWIFFISILK